jgi:hypothetical protein
LNEPFEEPNSQAGVGSQSKPEPPKPKQKLNPLVDLPLWAVWKEAGYEVGPRHFPMPEFKTFRELDRFLYVWSRGIEWLEESEYAQASLPKRVNYITSLWALAGRTTLLDTYMDFAEGGDNWYTDFAEGGDDWFNDLMNCEGDHFEQRFENFMGKRNKSFNYSNDEDEKIKVWRARLNDWDQKVSELQGEVKVESSDGSDSSVPPAH